MMDESFLDRLSRIGGAFQESKLVQAGIELGLYERLARSAATATELAEDLDVTLRGIEILADALVATGYLDKHDGRYANSPDVDRHLVAGRPGSLAHIMGHRNEMFRSWALLDDVIRRGQSRDEHDKPTLADPVANRNFILGMAEVSGDRVGPLLAHLPLEDTRRLVDLGGGPGHYACEAARRHRQLAAVVVDLPLTVEVAREYVADQGLSERVQARICDFYRADELDLGGLADGVLISQVLHAEGEEQNRALLRKLYPQVQPGGWVAVVENLVHPSRTSPVAAAMFAVNMLAGTTRGRTYTAEEITTWLADAGFTSEPCIEIGERTWLTLARKDG